MTNVTPLGDPARHFWMTRSMARAVGVSLSEVMVEGRLSHKGFADLVTSCRQCQFVQDCEEWLAQQDHKTSQAPDCCQHAAVFEALKDVPREA